MPDNSQPSLPQPGQSGEGPSGYLPPIAGASAAGEQPEPYQQPGPYQQQPGWNSDQSAGGHPGQSAFQQPAMPIQAELPPERVGRGSLLALVALPVGMILSALIWQAGFIASLSIFVMAALLPFLYRKGSGGRVRKGIPVIIGLIVLGTVLSFFALVTGDLIKAYHGFGAGQRAAYGAFPQFWATNITYGPVLKSYGSSAGLFVLFAVLGGLSVVIRLVRGARARRA